MMKIGSRTPWGKADNVRDVAPGIQFVITPRHGGYKLSAKMNKLVPQFLREAGGWYEEDCKYAVVHDTFPQYFSAEDISGAHSTLKNWYPDEYEWVYGVKVKPEESHVLRRRAAEEAARGKLQSFAAWGDWHPQVPEGKVGLVAKINGRDGTGPERYFLVSFEDYKTRDNIFVVDLERAVEIGEIK